MTRGAWFIVVGVVVGLGAVVYWFKVKPIVDTANKATATFDKFIDWTNKGLGG